MTPAPVVAALVLLALAFRPAGQDGDPVGRLAIWIERARTAPSSVDAKRHAELRAILGDLRVHLASETAADAGWQRALVTLAGLEPRGTRTPDPALLASARLGRSELEAELARGNPGLVATLAFQVLAPDARRPRAERLLAAQLLGGARVRVREIQPVLRAVAGEDDAELARAAELALCGWADGRVHLYFLERLERDVADTRLAAEHFVRTHAELELPVVQSLQHEVARRYLCADWRQAARARGLGRALETERAAPILIEALGVWGRRAGTRGGSRRIQGEIVAELQLRSGRAMGADPERWSEWWRAVEEGRVALPETIAAEGGQTSTAAFFGLRAATDRVVFVVDRSGSMREGFGTGGRSRHAEAIDQLVRFLTQSGEETSFSVAVFADDGIAWRSRLTSATAPSLAHVQRWLEGKPPDGETRLYAGLRAALGLDARGRLDAERCEPDTVIVLCDGATTEGAGWVERWLAEENADAQLVFHCVQIGPGGNGTLEALAEGSGGQFVRVNG